MQRECIAIFDFIISATEKGESRSRHARVITGRGCSIYNTDKGRRGSAAAFVRSPFHDGTAMSGTEQPKLPGRRQISQKKHQHSKLLLAGFKKLYHGMGVWLCSSFIPPRPNNPTASLSQPGIPSPLVIVTALSDELEACMGGG